MRYFVFAPHVEAFNRLLVPLLSKGLDVPAVSQFDTVVGMRELAAQATDLAGSVLVIVGETAPTQVFEVARENGLVVWMVNDAYARAKAGNHPDVPKAEALPIDEATGKRQVGPDESAGRAAAAQGMASNNAVEPAVEDPVGRTEEAARLHESGDE